jgi:hypothetical protein
MTPKESILGHLAENHLELVWDYFDARLARNSTDDQDSERKYEPIPFRFHNLQKQLSRDPQLAPKKSLSWFTSEPTLFRFRGGRLPSNGFAEALRTRRQSVTEWLTDPRQSVQDFAQRHISRLDLMIADELRRAEAESEMYKRNFEVPGDSDDDQPPDQDAE